MKKGKTTKRTEESQKRTKFLFIIIILAAILSITGTYAWFSSQRDVEIVGFKINVEIAENLEVSLDGETWTHVINIENMRQFYGTYRDDDTSSLAYQAKTDDQRNYVPTELLPVSTVGTVDNGNLVFVTGEIKDKTLTDIKLCSESDITVGASIADKEANNDNHPYLVFDMYLRNLSRLTDSGDPLQLNVGSIVTAQEIETGLEFSARIGLVLYGETVSLMATGAEARAIQATGDEQVAIWEPNYRLHTPYIVANDARVSALLEDVDTYGIKEESVGSQIEDVTDNNDELLQYVTTNKPVQSEERGTEDDPKQEFATTEIMNLKTINGEDLILPANTISKVRVYIWLEGQDPDSIDLASTGQELRVTLRLQKPESGVNSGTTYAD